MQLSVKKYFAASTDRGANLDLISYALNDRVWLQGQFTRIAQIDNEQGRLRELDKIINWSQPGPGGFYDDLGDLGNQPHVVMEQTYKDDPSNYHSPLIGFIMSARDWGTIPLQGMNLRVSWSQYMHTLYGHPFKMHYTDLDKTAQYEIKVTYLSTTPIRLTADEGIMVHDYFTRPAEIAPVIFDVPLEATKDGDLTLTWEGSNKSHNGGCRIAEVWLMKKHN